jgi:hypothetical protein
MIDMDEFGGLARETEVYKDIELEILKEALSAWQQKPGDPYSVLELRDGKVLAGFAVMCREAGTDSSFDVRAMCIAPSYIGTGVPTSIIAMLEDEVLSMESSAILRFETSTRKEASIGTGILSRQGYALIGHIPDFYSPGDDYFMYARHLHRGPEKDEAAQKAEP